MDIRPIRNEADYDRALAAIQVFFENEPEAGSPEADRFDVLAALIESYERKHWPIDPPHPVAAIVHHMEARNITRSQLAEVLGSRSRASEILNRRRHLTLEMVWALHKKWGLPAEALIRPYRLKGQPKRAARRARTG
jgi:HTH-type transcriptional regulator/antitoxin HigA